MLLNLMNIAKSLLQETWLLMPFQVRITASCTLETFQGLLSQCMSKHSAELEIETKLCRIGGTTRLSTPSCSFFSS